MNGGNYRALPVLGVLLVAALLFCANLGNARTLTDHEAYPAAGARQMLATGNWLVPMVGDHTWLEKPPLLHWLDAASLAVFHENTEWVVRLPSVVAGLVLVVTISLLASSWFGPGYAFAAGLIQATSFYAFTYASLAEADMLLAATVAVATACFVYWQGIGLERSGGPRHAIAFWCLVGAGSLSKGVGYGSLMALLPAAAWLIAMGDRMRWRRMVSAASLIGLALGIGIALAWPLAMMASEPRFDHVWLMNTIGRALGETPYNQPWWYYATTIPWQVAPWTPLTLLSLGLAIRMLLAREPNDAVRFCLLWATVPVVLLSFSAGKHHHYLLPCLPALSLLSCLGLKRTADAIRRREGWAYGVGLVLVAYGALALAASLRKGSPYATLQTTAMILAGCAVALAMLFTVFARLGRPRTCFGIVAAGAAGLVLAIHFDIQPRTDTRRPDRDFFTSLDRLVPPGDPIIATGGQFVAQPLFFIGRHVTGVWRPGRVICHVSPQGVAYVVAARRYAPILRRTMRVAEVSASRYTYNEKGPQDRWALMRVTPDKDVNRTRLCRPAVR